MASSVGSPGQPNPEATVPSFCENCDDADFLFPVNDRCLFLPKDKLNAHAYFKLSTWTWGDVLECPICSLAAKLFKEADLKRLPNVDDTVTFWARRILSMIDSNLDSRWCPDLEFGFSSQPDGSMKSEDDFYSLRKLEMIMPDDVILQSYFRRRIIPSIADPAELKGWLSNCRYHHWHPKTGMKPLMGLIYANNFRLLDTSTLRFYTMAHGNRLPAYAALSYVWGLESGNRIPDSAATELSLNSLAPTLRDAVLMARSLGITHIWIDQLCVDRSSPRRLQETLLHMGSIYECAQLVIIAACSDSAARGLPGSPLNPRAKEPIFATATNDIDEELRIVASRAMGSGLNLLAHQPWSRRGWTFQEFALARRSLVILPDEIWFVCSNAMRREAYTTTRPSETLHPPPPELHLRYEGFDSIRRACNASDSGFAFSDYAAAVLEYTSRELTFEGDRLRAFSGFMSRVAPEDRIAARSGLPLLYFGEALTWNTNEYFDRGSPLKVPRERCYGEAPSWSWAFVPYPTWHSIRPNAEERPAFHYVYYKPERDLVHEIIGVPDRFFWTKLLKLGTTNFQSIPPPDYRFKRPSWDWHGDQLPTIHLMTIVFEANLERKPHEHGLPGLEHFGFRRTNRPEDSSDASVPWGTHFILDEEEFSSSNAAGVVSCAVVWVEHRPVVEDQRFCVFLLRKQHDFYGRAGSAMVVAEDFFSAINAPDSNARWQYIRLR